MTAQGAPSPGVVSPTLTWGSSETVDLSGQPTGASVQVGKQLAQVSLPEPAVCSLYFQAVLRAADPADKIVAFTLNLFEGLGRTTIPRQLTFANQPAVGSPLEFTLPFVPLHTLNVDTFISAFHGSLGSGEFAVDMYLVLSPLTRIPQQEQKIAFGMGVPGEADDLDDSLRDELQADAPSVEEMLSDEADERAHPPEVEVRESPLWLNHLIARLERRYGRMPSRTEVQMAIRRMRHRQRLRRR